MSRSAENRFRNKIMQRMYESCRNAASKPRSNLSMQEGLIPTDAKLEAKALQDVISAYWRGRNGQSCLYLKTTSLYACWRAGVDDLKSRQKISA